MLHVVFMLFCLAETSPCVIVSVWVLERHPPGQGLMGRVTFLHVYIICLISSVGKCSDHSCIMTSVTLKLRWMFNSVQIRRWCLPEWAPQLSCPVIWMMPPSPLSMFSGALMSLSCLREREGIHTRVKDMPAVWTPLRSSCARGTVLWCWGTSGSMMLEFTTATCPWNTKRAPSLVWSRESNSRFIVSVESLLHSKIAGFKIIRNSVWWIWPNMNSERSAEEVYHRRPVRVT